MGGEQTMELKENWVCGDNSKEVFSALTEEILWQTLVVYKDGMLVV